MQIFNLEFLWFLGDESEASKNMETELAGVREDLVETINAWVVKAIDSKVIDLINPKAKLPQVVFFRRTIPVIYDGAANEDDIHETIMAYKEPCVRDLTDTSFEHQTQAATGATTGDWLIHFFKVLNLVWKSETFNQTGKKKSRKQKSVIQY